MQNYYDALTQMKCGNCLLIDGATATELERKGVPQLPNAWNGGGALTHPHVLKSVHKQYISSGATVVISNTFATCKHILEDADQLHNFEKLNSLGVQLAREAREELMRDDVLIAGGISYWSFTGNHPTLEVLEANISEQAEILAYAGADLIMLEMMVDIDRMLVTLEAAQQTDLPVWVGFSCIPDKNGRMCLENGEPLQEAIKHCHNKNVDLINIMHTDVAFVDECLDILAQNWSGLVGVYAHSGKMIENNWTFNHIISPADYTRLMKGWIERGINLAGGCCGISSEHIEHMAEHLFDFSN